MKKPWMLWAIMAAILVLVVIAGSLTALGLKGQGPLVFGKTNTATPTAQATPSVVASRNITEFALPGQGSQPYRITSGPDGNLWFTEYQGNKIGRITPAGQITEFAVPTSGS
jgi:streptogramin lyase